MSSPDKDKHTRDGETRGSEEDRLLGSIRSHQNANHDASTTAKMLGGIALSTLGAFLGVVAHEATLADSTTESRRAYAALVACIVFAIGMALTLRVYVAMANDIRKGAAKWRARHPAALRVTRTALGLGAGAGAVALALGLPGLRLESSVPMLVGAVGIFVYALCSWGWHDPPPPDVELTAIDFASAGPGEIRLAIARTEELLQGLGSQLDQIGEVLDTRMTHGGASRPESALGQGSIPSLIGSSFFETIRQAWQMRFGQS